MVCCDALRTVARNAISALVPSAGCRAVLPSVAVMRAAIFVEGNTVSDADASTLL